MRISKYVALSLSLILSCALVSCAKLVREKEVGLPDDRVLASVEGEEITESDFSRALSRVPPAYREKYLTPEGKRQLLRSLIEDELFYLEGQELGLDRAADVEAEVKDFRKRIVRERVSENLKKKVTVDGLDVEKYYRENQDKYIVPERLRLSVIMLSLSKDADPVEMEEAQEKARDIIGRLSAGEEFEWLARQLSVHASGEKGGDLGFKPIHEISSDVADEALRIPSVGDVAGPVRGELGIYIVKLTGKQPESMVTLEEVRSDIEQALLKSAHDEAYKELLERLENRADIVVHDSEINQIGQKK